MKERIAIVIIDVQNDFCEHAVLAAKNARSLIEPLNKMVTWAIGRNFPCIYTRDWHPPNHCSFIPRGGPWAPHCVQGTYGAKFAQGLIVPKSSLVVDIETDPDQSNLSYSAFENTTLFEELKKSDIHHLITTGIATEYCVKETVLDALKFGFSVTLLTDLVRPVNINPNDADEAVDELKRLGVEIRDSAEYMSAVPSPDHQE
ncbi:MAG: isochorismatase family protein [Bacteroidetes bacterium]|nr:isochorismatase family protein [Bacteroidota bacterium]